MASATRTRRPKMTPEERTAYHAEQRAKLDQITSSVYTVLHTPAVWRSLLALTARLEVEDVSRGPVNCVAILGQLPTATDVRGKREWKKIGRYPAKGTTALRVWGPVRGRRADESTEGTEPQTGAETEAPDTTGERVQVFAAVPTYDISQTAGDDYTPEPRPAADPMACARRLLTMLREPLDLEDREGPSALRTVLAALAAEQFEGTPQYIAGQNAAEAASAAHLAALILGITPGMAPAPDLGAIVTGPRMTPAIKESAIRVIEAGRGFAALARS
ncbi:MULTISPECIES: hypothetical protein [unclassified Streptomyces]|uniref:hypothetical protein n=1 Tax=unclassified Streptomyces TaxID=2593676 RepID=UPI0035D91A24